MTEKSAQKGGIYQGWSVVAGAFLASAFAIGATHSSFGLFLVPATKELGISRADANTFLICMGLGSALLAPIAGRLVDRFPIPVIMSVGGVLFVLAMTGLAITDSPWVMLLLAFGPIAFSVDCAGGLAANTVTARWFRRHRGRALAFVGIAASVGGSSPLGGGRRWLCLAL
jgi:predicted MFS family arabinose efflux permease